MKPDKVFCVGLCSLFLVLTVHKTQYLFIPYWGSNQEKRVGYVTPALCMSAKQKILHGHGPSNLNPGIFVCSFDALLGFLTILLY